MQQAEKIIEEIEEFKKASGKNGDMEAVDVLHACETFIRIRFKGRDSVLEKLIRRVTAKNARRGYYVKKDFY